MSKEIETSDFFDDDELSFDVSSDKDESMNGNQLPFKICLNLTKEEDWSNFDSDPLPEIVKPKSKQISENIEINPNDFTDNQVYKINHVNEKLRLMVLYENVYSEFSKKIFTGIAQENKQIETAQNYDMQLISHGLKQFAVYSENLLEPLKISRFQLIPDSKRAFRMGRRDMYDMSMKMTLIAMTEQKEKQFTIKKGLKQGSPSLNKTFKNKIQKMEELLIEKATEIQESKILHKIDRILLEEKKQNQKVLKSSVDEYLIEMQRIHDESIKLLEEQMHYRDQIIHSRNIKKMQFSKKIIKNSEDFNFLISLERYFKILPDFGIQTEAVDRDLIEDLDSSFNKSF